MIRRVRWQPQPPQPPSIICIDFAQEFAASCLSGAKRGRIDGAEGNVDGVLARELMQLMQHRHDDLARVIVLKERLLTSRCDVRSKNGQRHERQGAFETRLETTASVKVDYARQKFPQRDNQRRDCQPRRGCALNKSEKGQSRVEALVEPTTCSLAGRRLTQHDPLALAPSIRPLRDFTRLQRPS